ncbi:MAG TPA: hypothetical protein IAB84_03550 [Candidatus Choladousia intestinigallinarum]|nr:hypothetical protein [Candidatus Choladousia intestinigallinarum]
MKQKLYGLSEEEAQKRMEHGEGNAAVGAVTKTYGQIVKENVFTLFNFLNFLIAGLLFAVGAYSNMLSSLQTQCIRLPMLSLFPPQESGAV